MTDPATKRSHRPQHLQTPPFSPLTPPRLWPNRAQAYTRYASYKEGLRIKRSGPCSEFRVRTTHKINLLDPNINEVPRRQRASRSVPSRELRGWSRAAIGFPSRKGLIIRVLIWVVRTKHTIFSHLSHLNDTSTASFLCHLGLRAAPTSARRPPRSPPGTPPFRGEAYLFHGTSPESAQQIARGGGLRVDLAGSVVGSMFGKGIYLAENVPWKSAWG